MKKSLLIILMLLKVCILFSQTNTITLQDTNKVTTQRWRDTCFALIDKSAAQIPSGYLMDYSLVPLNDTSFNGINSKNDTISESGQFFSLHNIFASANVNSNGTLPNSTDTLFIDAYRYQRNTGNIPLLFLYQPYQEIRPTALSQNLFSLTTDSVRLKDVAGRGTSPYDNKSCFAFTALQNIIAQFNGITFALPQEFWLMNGITSVSIDFGDGTGAHALTKNGTISIYYNTEGTKYLTATITTTGGTLRAKSSIQYSRPLSYIKADTTWNITVPPVYTSMDQYLGDTDFAIAKTDGTTGAGACSGAGSIFDQINCDINPGATVTIVNGCDHVFDKPIIIVEGFDPTNSINYDFLNKNFDYYYPFITTMRSLGYDFVFVVFTKNTDFIENNAKVLEQVIDNVNALKIGTNTSTIIGWSMGGLVARYCLKDMEDRGINHKVGKYFSYDAPQQGANVPLGLQYMFQEMEYDMPYLKYFKQFLQISDAYGSAAAREMLVTKGSYYNKGIFSLTPNLYTLDPVRAQFAQELITKGYPQKTTNYGISFGRGNNTAGTKNGGNGAQFGNFIPGSGIFDGVLNYLLVNMHGTCYAVPENANNKICLYRYFGLKVVSIFGVTVPVGITLRIRNFIYQGYYPYDDAPGGYENTQSQFVDQFNGAFKIYFNGSLLRGYATNYNHYGHAFVPAASALDLQNQGYGSANSFQSNNMYGNIDNSILNPGQITGNTLNPSSLSPFNSVETYTSDCATAACQSYDDDYQVYEGANWNLHHDAPISNQTSAFIIRKILNANPTASCPGLCNTSDYKITSSASPICNTAILKLNSAYPIDYNINWSFPNGLLSIQNGQGTPNVTVQAIGSGTETATVVVSNSCGQQATYILSIQVGVPPLNNVQIINHEDPSNCVPPYSGTSHFVVGNFSDPNIQIENISGALLYTVNNAPATTITIPSFLMGAASGFNNTVTLNVRTGNVCGWGAWRQIVLNVCPGTNSSIVSPNPSTGMVTVSTNTSQSQRAELSKTTVGQSKIYQINVIGFKGNMLKQIQYPSGVTSTSINLTSLSNGTYTLQIFDNVSWTSKQVIILK